MIEVNGPAYGNGVRSDDSYGCIKLSAFSYSAQFHLILIYIEVNFCLSLL